MRAVAIVFLLVLLGVGAWLLLRDHDTLAPPMPSDPTVQQAPPKPAPAQATVRTPAPVQPAPAPSTTGQGEPTTAPTPVPTPAATPNVILVVRAITTREPVPAFRWQFRNSRGTQRGEGVEGRAELALEASAVGELLVEAEGLAPLLRPDVIVPTPPAGPLTLDLFLGPTVPAAGITLFVRDVALAPIQNVRVEAFQLKGDAPPANWQLGTPMWARRSPAADGRYVLPTLAAGNYGIRVLAIDDQNVPLPMLPWRRTFALTGDNGFVEDVALEPGALLALDLVDAAGQPYDAAQRGAATLKLHLTGGPDVRREWIVQNELASASAIDALPGVGTLHLAEAVIAGPYSLDVLVQGKPRVRNEQMFLRPGIVNTVRVVVP